MTLSGNALRHGAGELGSRVPLVVLELILARTLGPVIYGLWSMLQTVILYGNFLHFGVVSSLTRKEPGMHQRGDSGGLAALRSATYGFQIAVVVLVLALVSLAGLIWPSLGSRFGGNALFPVLIITILLQQIQITAQASAINSFYVTQNARARVLFSVVFFGLGILASRQEPPLVWLMSAWSGALIASTTTLYISLPSIRARPRLDPAQIRLLLQDGFPIFIQGLLRLLLSNIDKLMVWLLAPAQVLGIYALGTLAAGLTGMFSSIVLRVSLPTLLRLRERDQDGPHIANEVTRTLWFALLASFFAACIAGAFAPLFIHFLLPAYREGYWTTTILACTGSVIGLSQAAADIALSFGVKRLVLSATLLFVPVMPVLIALVWAATASTVVVALVTLPVFTVYASWLVHLCFKASGLAGPEAAQRTLRILRLVPVLALLALGLTWMQTMLLGTVGNGLTVIVIGNTLFGGALLAVALATFSRMLRF